MTYPFHRLVATLSVIAIPAMAQAQAPAEAQCSAAATQATGLHAGRLDRVGARR